MSKIVSGRTIVKTAGKAVPLTIDSLKVRRIDVFALTNQSGTIAIGDKDISQLTGNENGLPLLTKEAWTELELDLSEVYIDSDADGDGVRWLAVV